MKKIILTYCLLAFSLTSFSQQEIENWSHPFQVLFVDSTNLIGENRQIRQFDFLSKYDLLEVKGNITLVHFTGKIVELNNLKLKVKDLAEIHHKEGYFERPIISDHSKFRNRSKVYNKNQEVQVGCHDCGGTIQILYPMDNENDRRFLISMDSVITFVWEYSKGLKQEEYFQVRISNIFDETILLVKTRKNNLQLLQERFSNKFDMYVIRVSVFPQEENSSGDYGILLKDARKGSLEKNKEILIALSEDWT
jgi:hypothetical protein